MKLMANLNVKSIVTAARTNRLTSALGRPLMSFYMGVNYGREIKLAKNMKTLSLNDAREFLTGQNLISSGQTMPSLAEEWSHHVQNLFNSDESEQFYLKWKGSIGASNIAANIADQFRRPYLLHSMIGLLEGTKTLLDFGCGTGAVVLSWQKNFSSSTEVFLADVDNLSRDFTRFYAVKHPKLPIRFVDLDLNSIPDGSIDAILCIHVLEHLRNPSEIFKLLDKKIKNGGLVFLEAPWGGHPEHLAEAPIDWEKNGGKELLKKQYRHIKTMNPFLSFSGIYRKTESLA